MMWLVRVALERPYTFVIMSILIAVLGIGSIFTMPTDIFPAINFDLIVLGSPTNKLTEQDFHTSTVLQVISHVMCPVLCVPASRPHSAKQVVHEVASV